MASSFLSLYSSFAKENSICMKALENGFKADLMARLALEELSHAWSRSAPLGVECKPLGFRPVVNRKIQSRF
jgi:hypothetical protein